MKLVHKADGILADLGLPYLILSDGQLRGSFANEADALAFVAAKRPA